jgi:hypothetical protein
MRAMSFLIPAGGCSLRAAVSTTARSIDPENWDGLLIEQESWRALCAYVLDGRLHAYLVDERDETYEAERSQFAGLAGRHEALSPIFLDIFAFRDSHGRRVLGGQLFFYEDELHAVLSAGSAEKATQKPAEAWKGHGGRPPRYDHDMIEAEVLRLMDHHGEFIIGDAQWNCQARLEEALMPFCKKSFGREPARSTLQAPIQSGLDKWREKRREIADN